MTETATASEIRNDLGEIPAGSLFDEIKQATEQDQNPPKQQEQPAAGSSSTNQQQQRKAPNPEIDLDEEDLTMDATDCELFVYGATEGLDVLFSLLFQKISGEFKPELFEANKQAIKKLQKVGTKILERMAAKPNPYVILIFLILVCWGPGLMKAMSIKKTREAAAAGQPLNSEGKRGPGRPTKQEQEYRETIEKYSKKK